MKKNLVVLMSAMLVTLYTVSAFAQEATGGEHDKSFGAAIAAGLAIGLGAFGGALGQGRVASAALEGIARNPGADSKIGPRMILGLVLIESLVIYALLIAFFLQGKV